MIESRLDPLTDGNGGGYGNYPGLSVEQIADRFRTLAEEGHNRSARAILRIVHEQTMARGTLGIQRMLAAIGLACTLALGVARFVVASEKAQAKITLYLGASALATALFVAGSVSVHRTAKRNKAQVAEIRRLALLALARVVETPGFVPKPLEREHLRSLNELKKADPAAWRQVSARLL